MASTPCPGIPGSSASTHDPVWQQQTLQYPVAPTPTTHTSFEKLSAPTSKFPLPARNIQRIVATVTVLALILLIYFIWNPPTPAPTSSGVNITQQSFSSNSTASSTSFSNSSSSTYSGGSTIQVYIVGAVKKPGVYTLASDARIYQLLQAAGGPTSKANLVALNLAASLKDGEEIYVTVIGEIPPTYMGGVPGPSNGSSTTSGTSSSTSGGLVNINTATADQMRQELHVSSTTAQNIINYRTQNGPYTSVDQLLQVISKEIYDRIQNMVTV
jgi:competence protein ComEA